MTVRYYCDRCDQEEDNYSLKTVKVPEIKGSGFELCEKCIKALARFLKVKHD